MRVTLDTDIYISGLNYRGNPSRLLQLARCGELPAIVSDSMLDEAERMLQEMFSLARGPRPTSQAGYSGLGLHRPR